MKKVLIAYDSRTGNTEKMAEYIAEGVRIAGHEAELKKIGTIKKDAELQGYDAYVFGCPTYHRDMTNGMKTFLFLVQKAGLEGKVAGDAPKLIFDTMEYVFKMGMVDLGSFNLKEHIIATGEGLRTCQDYGKAVGQKLSNTM